MNSKDKRGMNISLEVLLGIIIAIPLVILLFYLGSSIASIFFGSEQAILKAQGNLENIIEAINYEKEFLFQSVSGWFFISSSKTMKDGKVILSTECENENCVCICPKKFVGKVDCSKKGQCETIKKPLLENDLLVYRKATLSKFKITKKEDSYKLEEINK